MCPPTSFATTSNTITSPASSPPKDDFFPSTEICQSAYKLASYHLELPVLNHSIRVYLYASALAKSTNSIYSSEKHDLLFTACILHDIGTSDAYDGPERFEVEGGDAATALLRGFNVKENDIHDVWVAIALHTSAGIAERISELARIVREAVLTDFGKTGGASESLVGLKGELEEKYPRLEVEKVLGDHVVGQALRRPQKAPPASWPGILYRAHLTDPDWKGVNKAF